MFFLSQSSDSVYYQHGLNPRARKDQRYNSLYVLMFTDNISVFIANGSLLCGSIGFPAVFQNSTSWIFQVCNESHMSKHSGHNLCISFPLYDMMHHGLSEWEINSLNSAQAHLTLACNSSTCNSLTSRSQCHIRLR